MERNFTDENMEEFLLRNADGLRMRPSARVWRGISSHLNRRRRRLGFIFGTSLLLTTAFGYYLVSESTKNFHNSVSANSSSKAETISKQVASISKSNTQFVGVNNSLRNNRNVVATNPVEDQQYTFTQFLLNKNVEAVQNTFIPTVVDSYFDDILARENNSSELSDLNPIDPLSIESVVNSYSRKTRKFRGQFYFTPTVSYRKLSDNTIASIMPHKPAFGFELGFTSKYPVSRNVKLRAGLQFNVNRYEIKTWDSYAQLATVRLNDRNGVDYVRTITNYNNFSGYKISWLQNLYVQLSAPVGVEVKVAGDNKIQLGVASTLQPTYMLGDKSYLLSADYKNYTEMPKLVRHWNVNSSLETFVAYSTGHLNWQVGPQVRYQLLSSYLKKYPVKENLFDFGLKVGISVNK